MIYFNGISKRMGLFFVKSLSNRFYCTPFHFYRVAVYVVLYIIIRLSLLGILLNRYGPDYGRPDKENK